MYKGQKVKIPQYRDYPDLDVNKFCSPNRDEIAQ